MAIRADLREELMKLTAKERLKLADQLYESVAEEDDPELQQAWATELRSRIEDIRAGLVEGIPADEVFAKLRAESAARQG